MPDLGPAELIIVLLVVVMIFGGSRLAEIGGSLGKGIKEFKSAIKDDDESPASEAAATFATGEAGTAATLCGVCSSENVPSARFCAECGAALQSASVHATA